MPPADGSSTVASRFAANQSMDPKFASHLYPFVDGFTVRTALLTGSD